MKKIILILCILLFAFTAKAQVVNVCGTDSITLSVDNYVNGTIEWQESIDTLSWVTIPEVFGMTYTFFPTQTKYYRAVVKTSTCDPLYSAFSFVQLPPIANAGVDKVTGASYTILQGNKIDGAIGEWKVISGSGGVISEPNNPISQFAGIQNQVYNLTWTFTNACGQSTDTVNVLFEENVFNKNYIVVDNTDSLYSDSTEMATGLYRIKFSDPTIIPAESVLLLGMREDVSFLRKVTSFTLQDSVYSFITEQGTLDDLLLSGTINFGDAINQSIQNMKNGSQSSRVKKLNTFPTRQTLKEYADNKDVILLYSGKTSYDNRLKVASSINSPFVFQVGPGKIYYDLYDNVFEPNFVCEYTKSPFHLKFGLCNSKFSFTQKIEFNFSVSGTGSVDQKLFSLFNYPLIIPPGIVIDVDIPFKVYSNVSIVGGPILTITDNFTSNFSTLIESHEYFNSEISSKFNEKYTRSIDLSSHFSGGIEANFKMGPEVQFRIFEFLVPYGGFYAKANFNFRTNTDLNFSGKAAYGLVGNLGVKCEIPIPFTLKYSKLFDFYKEFSSDDLWTQLNWPNKIELVSGNNQKGIKGTALTKPVVFKVTDPFGNGNPYVPVRIELESGNGSVQSSVLGTDLLGQINVNWTLGSNDECKLKAYVLDYDNEDIKGSPIYVMAYSSGGATTCENSNLAITMKATSTYKYPSASGGTAPYTYSTNDIDYSSIVPQFNLSTLGSFTVYVKDKNQCLRAKTFTISALNPCDNTDLTMDIVTTSSSVCITGKKGTAPYLYAIENQINFTANNIFSNLISGYHTVYVKDANGCIVSSDVNIQSNTTASIRALYPAQGASSIPVNGVIFQWVAANYTTNQVYDLYLKKGSEAYGFIASNLSKTTYSYNTALANNTTYTWKVIVKSGSNVLDYCEFTYTSVLGIATINTIALTNISETTATSGGNVTSDGGANVTVRGVCWNTSGYPTTADSKTTNGSGTGSFTSNLTNLIANNTYFVRAYAINSVGIAYGNDVRFTTGESITKPIVSTNSISNITQTTATCGGLITSDGGATVTAKGTCWNTTGNPTIANSKTSEGSGNGSFTSNLTDLIPNTSYYLKAYATNSLGSAYGDQVAFTTLSIVGESIIPSNSCSTAKIMNVKTLYSVSIDVNNYTLGVPIEGESYGGANVRGFWLAFKVPSNWDANHDVKISNVSSNFDPVFGIRGGCTSPYLAQGPDIKDYVNKNGKGGNETSDTNLPGSENYGDSDNIYYVRIYHYKGSETPKISFDIIVE